MMQDSRWCGVVWHGDGNGHPRTSPRVLELHSPICSTIVAAIADLVAVLFGLWVTLSKEMYLGFYPMVSSQPIHSSIKRNIVQSIKYCIFWNMPL